MTIVCANLAVIANLVWVLRCLCSCDRQFYGHIFGRQTVEVWRCLYFDDSRRRENIGMSTLVRESIWRSGGSMKLNSTAICWRMLQSKFYTMLPEVCCSWALCICSHAWLNLMGLFVWLWTQDKPHCFSYLHWCIDGSLSNKWGPAKLLQLWWCDPGGRLPVY